MVEKTISRDCRVEGDDYIAVKTTEVTNMHGKKVVYHMEEHNITTKEMDSVIQELAKKELDEVTEQEEKYVKDLEMLNEELKGVDPAFFEDMKKEDLRLQEFFQSEDYKMYLDIKSKKQALENAEAFLKEVEVQKADIEDWKQQMIKLKGLVEKQ